MPPSRSVRLALSALLCGFVYAVAARSIIPASPEQAAKLADYVYDAIVTEVRELTSTGESCGFLYTATVLNAQKGGLSAKETFSFGYKGGLQVGTQYRIFLFNDPTAEKMLASIKEVGAPEEEVQRFVTACQPQYTTGNTFFRAISLGNPK